MYTLRTVVVALGFCCSSAGAQQLSREPYLQLATPDSVTVAWRTVGGTIPILRYGPAPDLLVDEVLPVQMVIRLGPDVQGPAALPRLHSAPPGTYQYEATAFGLQAGTRYFYGIFDNGELIGGGDAQHHFTTLPASGTAAPLRLWITGDTGEGSLAQISGFEGMRQFATADGRGVDAYLHLGDMAYEEGADSEFSANFFDIYAELLRNTVVWPTMGNHEGFTSSGATQTRPYYDAYVVPTEGQAGGVPSGTEAYYSFDIGRVHFICLDSYDLDRSPAGDMALWLRADLEMTDADWLIAFWHHPPYTKGTHDSDSETELIEMREQLMPILESAGVDLVLTGHSHIYERSMLIDGAYATPTTADGVIFDDGDGHPARSGAYRKSAALHPNNGTVAVVAGNGEGAARPFAVMPVMRAIVSEVGSVIIDIDGEVLTARMINASAEVRDEFQIIKRGEVVQRVVEDPWQPTGPEFVVERLEPGLTRVEIFPVPDVPDAVLRYTADGSPPDAGSPIYSEPLEIAGDEIVRAFNTWRGGEQIGLVGESSPLPAEFSLHRYPAAAADDGVEDAAGNVVLEGETLTLGNGHTVGLRFTDVRIPRGAFLVSAEVQFFKASPPERMPTEGVVQVERAADSAPFSGVAGEFSGRAKTAAIPWTVRTWSGSRRRDLNTVSPDLSEIVREVIELPAWRAGNAMSFFLSHAGDGRTAGAFDRSKADAASLSVTYIDPQGLAESLAAQSPVVERRANGNLEVSMRWPAEDIAAQLGLSYEIEASTDLVGWSRPAALISRIAGVGADGFGRLNAEFSRQLVLGKQQFYFRVRVLQAAG